jgi:tRNA modification GTPase
MGGFFGGDLWARRGLHCGPAPGRRRRRLAQVYPGRPPRIDAAGRFTRSCTRVHSSKAEKESARPQMAKPTIYALSSGPGRAGVAVIRISGPVAGLVLDRMAGPRPAPRVAAVRRIKDPQTAEVLDEALVLWFPGPKSETGEDMAELQVHGGRAVVAGVLSAVGGIVGCRLAEPGEFARRAFEGGKLDLTGVEGLADLIDAETAAQRRQALRQAGGALARLYEGWREQLIEALALVEAAIDFAEEADIASDTLDRARLQARTLQGAIDDHLNDGRRGEITREGLQVVLAGPPNAGKSSLLNALARRDVAIVSDEPGTTRDVIEVKLDLHGLAIVVSDTAGLRVAEGKVEQEGIRRTLARARSADLVVWLIDATDPQPVPAEVAGVQAPGGDNLLIAVNKIDLCRDERSAAAYGAQLAISATTGAHLDTLTACLAEHARRRMGDTETTVLTQARHRAALAACSAALTAFLAPQMPALELAAEDLRSASRALGRLTGRVDVEDVLEQVFGRFCIGK